MESENQILIKTRELFFKYGVKSITMDDIATNLGMSKKTIYAAFPDKKALLTRMVTDYLSFHKEDTNCNCELAENAIERMLLAAAAGLNFMEKINPVFLYDMKKYFGEVWAIFEEYRNKEIRAEIRSCLVQGQSEGHIRPDLDVEIAVSMHMQHVDMMVEPAHFESIQKSRNEVIKTILITFLTGISTPKGLKAMNKILENNDPFHTTT